MRGNIEGVVLQSLIREFVRCTFSGAPPHQTCREKRLIIIELGNLTKEQSEAFLVDERNFDLRGNSLFNSPTI